MFAVTKETKNKINDKNNDIRCVARKSEDMYLGAIALYKNNRVSQYLVKTMPIFFNRKEAKDFVDKLKNEIKNY